MDAIDKALDNISRFMFGMPIAESRALLTAGDWDALDRAIDRTLQIRADQAEARRRARDANEARTRAQAATVAPTPYKLVSILGEQRTRVGRRTVSRETCRFYVTGLSFGDGGLRDIRKVSFGRDAAKAHRFSAATAVEIAGRLARSYTDVRVEPAV